VPEVRRGVTIDDDVEAMLDVRCRDEKVELKERPVVDDCPSLTGVATTGPDTERFEDAVEALLTERDGV
jgi:hypothetical protein